MSGIKYEHHMLGSVYDSICPFKVEYDTAEPDSMANWHKNPELIYITSGKGNVQCGAQSFNAEKGDIFAVSPETIHNVCSTEDMGYYFIIIDEKFCRTNGIELERYMLEPKINDSGTESRIRRIIDVYQNRNGEKSWLYAAKMRGAVIDLFVNICESHARYIDEKKGIGNSDAYVRKAIVYISENYNRTLTIEEIAKELGVTKFHLSREFRKYTGETAISHLNKVRIARARQMICAGCSVTQAAMECGFESVSYFSQKFKAVMGISPSEYVRNIRG